MIIYKIMEMDEMGEDLRVWGMVIWVVNSGGDEI